ncbi:hypothetical protein LJC32_05115 [Oscillospiraceae bacterium OttesenSCG-928-F05]|nr:hypothetical protein [Oscillospiraceae bacterium OttesenSCG-928-F05]
MKIIVSGGRRSLVKPAALLAALVCLICAAVLVVGAAGNTGPVEDTAADGTVAVAAMAALEYYGAPSADRAVSIWAEGVRLKNGATQYSVMSAELREVYAGLLEDAGKGWVFETPGGIDSYLVTGVVENDDGSVTVELNFVVDDLSGDTQNAQAKLLLEAEGDYVVISGIESSALLDPFTGLGG